jgi:putative colanic acid biosynthesis acetyltransferase WcaB
MKNCFLFIIFSPFIIWYKFITEFVLNCEIPASVEIGNGLVIHHGQGLVMNNNVKIGENVTLKHHTTLGNKFSQSGEDLGSPIIGNNVSIGPHSILIGPIKVGDNSIIGAGSVVVKDVPCYSIVAGNPAKVIKFIKKGGAN